MHSQTKTHADFTPITLREPFCARGVRRGRKPGQLTRIVRELPERLFGWVVACVGRVGRRGPVSRVVRRGVVEESELGELDFGAAVVVPLAPG